MLKKTLYTTLISCVFVAQIQSTVVTGDPDATTGNTFSFVVGHAKYSVGEAFSRLWLASGQTITTDAAKEYALSYVIQIPAEPLASPVTGQIVIPSAKPMANPQAAYIFVYNISTGQVDTLTTANPIYGANFSFFDTFQTKPIFVVSSDLNKIYSVYDIQHYDVQTTENFNKTELLLYDLGDGQITKALLGASEGIFAAYANGVFGTATSKIAKFIQTSQVNEGQSKPQPFIHKIADETITTSTPALRGGGGVLASFGPNITLHNVSIGKSSVTYAGVQTTANSVGGDKAAGIMMVNTLETQNGYNLLFDGIADNGVISDTANTIISAPTNETIRITNIATMHTSTSLNYLVVARDNGTGPQSIYAAPIVSTGSNTGKIADATSVVTTFNTIPPSYSSRNFDTLLTDPTQIDIDNPTDFTEQITVGAGAIPLASGNITKLYTSGDSVYVVIGSAYGAGTQPGTFYSQAIFAQDGHIISWTPWARVLGSDNPMLYSRIGSNSTVNFYVADASGGTDFKTVVHTQWGINNNLSPMFTGGYLGNGGTQGIFSFGQFTPGFNNAVSLLITTGYNHVTIGQTGYVNGGQFKIEPMSSSTILSFDDVNESKALVAAEIAHNGSNHWLFAGGASGVVVLTDDATGYTWTGNLASIAGLDAGQTWKNVGSFSYVKKLISDDTFLYVLTRDSVYRIELSANKFKATPTADLNPVSIITRTDLSSKPYFLDLIIDNGFCILGTTNGMYSFEASSGKANSITKITIPDGLRAAAQLIAVSNSNTPQKSFKAKSNLFVLNNTFETQQTRLNRFVITDGTIAPFNDALYNSSDYPDGIPTSFIRFSQYYSNYYTNGSCNIASNYFLGINQPSTVSSPSMLQVFPIVQNGKSSSHIILPTQTAKVPTQFLTGSSLFLGVIRESTSGAFIASGSLIARINA